MLPTEAQKRVLSYVAQHIQLSADEEAFFLSILEFKTLKKKEVLLQEGEVCRYDYFVTKGCLRCFNIDESGTERIAMFAIEDWWISDLYSLLTQTPARLTIDALEDSEMLLISKQNMETLYERVPKFERLFRILLQKAYVALELRIVQSLSNTAEERFEAFNTKYPGLFNRITQKHVAAYLGITPEFLSMLRKKAMSK
jgi:CRP-like cAMP-binding protein